MVRDFVPISLLTTGHYMLVAHPSVTVKSARDLIVLAKVRPGQLNYASAGNGNARWFGFSAGNSGTPMGGSARWGISAGRGAGALWWLAQVATAPDQGDMTSVMP